MTKRKPLTQEHKDNIAKAHIGVKGKPHTQVTKDKISESMSGEKHWAWKGGEYKRANGRWFIWIDGIKYRRARYVAMKYLKRELTPEEIVHHINEDKGDDKPENLYLFANQGEHAGHHRMKNPPVLLSNLI